MIAGQQVTPTLRLSRLLGQGGMGSVWIADHLALGTQVAVKFMAPAFAQHPGFVERFRREAMAAAQIKSPHVAQVFDHGVAADGAPYIVMELLDGEDLKHRVKRLGPLPPAEVAHIVAQASKALGRAHHLGIIHRDIKPDNLFILDMEGEPFVKVLDFGVAKLAVEGNLAMTSTGSMMGTPLYMSPEQLLSAKHVDFHADLWALAVVAYFALTGQVPFTGETLGALSVAVHAGMFTPPSAVRPGLPPAIDVWIRKALQRDPAARFSSARELSEALAVAVGEGARPPMPSAGDLSAYVPAPGAAQADTGGGGSGRTPSGAELGGSGAQGRSLAAVATTGHAGGGRGLAAVIALMVVTALAAIGVGVFLVTRRVPEDHSTQTVNAASSTASPTLADSAAADRAAPTIIPAASPAASTTDSAAPPETSARTPAPVATLVASMRAAASPAPAGAAPARSSGASKPVPTSKPAPTKDTVGF